MRSRLRRASGSRKTVARIESVESRTLMSASPSFSLVHDPASLDALGRGRGTILVPAAARPAGTTGATASSELAAAETVTTAGAFDIQIQPGPGLQANAAALAAFNRAAEMWEARITDPITVYIDAELSPLSDPNVIGQTQAVYVEDPYQSARDAIVADAADESDDGIVASLPTASQAKYVLPSGTIASVTAGGSGAKDKLMGTKAAFKALGLPDTVGGRDGTITFNSNFSFDFDRGDGVDGSHMDFQTVAAHEIGHMLGFTSNVDYNDSLFGLMLTSPTTLDLFRFEDGSSTRDPQDAAQFTTFPRSQRPGVAAVTDQVTAWAAGTDPAVEYGMSTGASRGDGRQASHWKDGDLTGRRIGILDPTLGYGQVWDISDADWRALDLIGWDIGGGSGVPANAAPDAVNDAGATGEDAVLTVAAPGVLANDTDADGDPVSAVAGPRSSAQGAAVTVNADGSYSYDPGNARALQDLAAGATATDTFTYAVSDGRGGTDTATVTVTVTGADEAPGTTPPGDGLKVAFFSGSVMPTTAGTETLDADGVVAEDWGVAGPAGLPSDNFTARWRGQLLAPASGDFTFYAKVDDNVRLWIDDATNPSDTPRLIIRRWGTANTSEFKSNPVALVQGRRYNIQMDFREMTGSASAFLRYGSAGAGVAKQIIPKSNLYSHAAGQAPAVLADPYLTDKKRNNDNTTVGIDNGNGASALTPAAPAVTGKAAASKFSSTAAAADADAQDELEALLA